ncbi:hypothetical protein FACS189468_1410 [Spirochaetia bacterium]|nr:hypothetical protein FACS189468_1410 [Spirochaetia bacterium]
MKEAEGFYRKANSKRSSLEAERKLLLAIQAGGCRDYGKAVVLLEGIIAEYDGPPEAFLYLGRALNVLKDYSRALVALNDYIRLKPKNPAGYIFAGRTCLILGFYPRAVWLLEKALVLGPGNPFTMALLGMAYLKAKHSGSAVDMLQRAVEAAPDNQRIYRAYLNALFIRAIRLCHREDYTLGSEMLRFVLENGRDSPLIRLELGRAARELGDLQEALEHYTRALEFTPRDPNIRWYRASILMDLGMNAEAIKDLSIIRDLGGDIPELPWNSELVDRFMIRSFLEAGEWRRAAEACRNWMKRRKDDPMIHAMYAEAQRNMKKYGSAQNHLNRALKLDPTQLQLWYALIMVAWEGGDWKALKRALTNAKKHGGEKELLDRFSILYESETTKDPRHMVEVLQKAIRTLGPEPELMFALGKGYLKTGLTEASVSWFQKIMVLQKDHEGAYLGIIAAREVLFNEKPPSSQTDKSGSPAAARKELAKAYDDYLRQWPDNRAIRRDRAIFLVRVGVYEKAAKELEALLASEPANTGLRRVLAYTYRKTGRFQDAEIFLKPLLKERPRDLNLLLEYAGCLQRSGAVPQARAILEKALPLFPRSPDILMALGILTFREGRVERAFDLLRESTIRAPGDPRPYHWMAVFSRKNGENAAALRYETVSRQFSSKKPEK